MSHISRQRVQVHENLNDRKDKWENCTAFMRSLPVQGRCGTKEVGRWTSSSPEWVRVISKWHIPCSHGFDFEYNVSFLRAVSNNSQI